MREIKFRAWSRDTDYAVRAGSKGWYMMSGYVMRLAPYHPYANSRGYVPEHRLIMENMLDRYLIPRKELIHHIDGDRSNNQVENLRLSNPKDHAKGHIGERNNNGQFIAEDPKFETEKYRLYDKDRRLLQIYNLQELISKTFRRGKFEYRGKFTGLKDENGKEIYEGDIVKINNNLIEEMKWVDETNWMAEKCPVNGWVNHQSIYKKPIEVIGNIYENKELLKERR